jgi:uncharacterized membrane protein
VVFGLGYFAFVWCYFNISYYVCTFFAGAKKDTKESTSPAHRSAGAAELYAVVNY